MAEARAAHQARPFVRWLTAPLVALEVGSVVFAAARGAPPGWVVAGSVSLVALIALQVWANTPSARERVRRAATLNRDVANAYPRKADRPG